MRMPIRHVHYGRRRRALRCTVRCPAQALLRDTRAGAAQFSPPCGLWCEGALGLCKPIAKRRARAAHAVLGSAGALAIAHPMATAPFYLRVWERPAAPVPAHARWRMCHAPSAALRCAHMRIDALIIRGRRHLHVALEIWVSSLGFTCINRAAEAY